MNGFEPRALALRGVRHLACTLALALAACSDGGADGPSLAVQSASATAATGGPAVVLHAVSGGSGTLSWSLAGPGALSATTGDTVNYLPPDGEAINQAGTATITVSAGALSRQTSISVTAATLAGHAWEVSREPSVLWQSVTAAGSTFVATGYDGAIATSSDGSNWLQVDIGNGAHWASAALGPAGWVAIGLHGELATSPDGVGWTLRSPLFASGGTFGPSAPQVVVGNGLYVAVYADASYVSVDGQAWTTHASGFASIAFGQGVFVATGVGSGGAAPGLYASADGVQWTLAQAVPLSVRVNDVAFGNGIFVASDLWSVNYTSRDGLAWTSNPNAPPALGSIDFAGGTFYAVGESVVATMDGVAWSALPLPAPWWANYSAARFASNGSTLVAAFQDGSIASGPDLQHLSQVAGSTYGTLAAVDYANGRYVAAAPDASSVLILSSPDGRTWTPSAGWQETASGFTPNSIAHAPDGTFVAAGISTPSIVTTYPTPARPMFAYSRDGVAWTIASYTVQGERSAYVLHDGQRFVCIDQFGYVYASADGMAWQYLLARVSPQTMQQVDAVAFGNGRYVAVGDGAATSPDGLAWTGASFVTSTGATAPAPGLTSVLFDGARFVAVGLQGAVATSADGSTWSVTTSATAQHLSGIARSSAGVLVAVGDHGVTESSVDAVHWTLRTSGASQGLRAVAAGNGAFVAVGENSRVERSTH